MSTFLCCIELQHTILSCKHLQWLLLNPVLWWHHALFVYFVTLSFLFSLSETPKGDNCERNRDSGYTEKSKQSFVYKEEMFNVFACACLTSACFLCSQERPYRVADIQGKVGDKKPFSLLTVACSLWHLKSWIFHPRIKQSEKYPFIFVDKIMQSFGQQKYLIIVQSCSWTRQRKSLSFICSTMTLLPLTFFNSCHLFVFLILCCCIFCS